MSDPRERDASQIGRRDFVRATAAGAAGLMLAAAPASASAMPERVLGRTGRRIRIFGLGGQATLEMPARAETAVRIVERALQLGVNYFDTAPSYGDGASQRAIGEGLGRGRREIFLASKTLDHGSRDAAWRELETSLRRLRTDYLDLWQIHNLRRPEDLDAVFGKGGCLEALVQARDQRIVRHLGITGHYDPAVLVEALERFDFDCVLAPLNPADRHPVLFLDRMLPAGLADKGRLSFVDRLLPVARRRQVGVIGMKVSAHGRLFRPDGVATMKQALSYTLTLPITHVVVGCDTVEQLEANVALARDFRPLTPAQMANLEAATAGYVHEAAWFKRGGNGFRAADGDAQH